jgi:MYXO-CTERM domain-containing protein
MNLNDVSANRTPSTKLFSLLFALSATLAAPAAGAYTLNPNGGTRDGDGLRVEIAANTQMQVWRAGVAQGDDPTAAPPSARVNNSVYLAIGPALYGATCVECAATAIPWTPVSQTAVTGAGTATDPFRGTTVVRAGVDGPTVTLLTTYALNDDAIVQHITVEIPPGNRDAVKLYHVFDTYLGGYGAAPAYARPLAGTPSVFGVKQRGTFVVFASPVPMWNDWFSGDYLAGHARVMGGGDLFHTLDADPSTDNAIGAQWNLGGDPGRREVSYRMGFAADAPCDMGGTCVDGGVTAEAAAAAMATPDGAEALRAAPAVDAGEEGFQCGVDRATSRGGNAGLALVGLALGALIARRRR